MRLEYEIRYHLDGSLLNVKLPCPHLQWPFCEPYLPDWHTPVCQSVGTALTASAALGQPVSLFAFDRDPNSAFVSQNILLQGNFHA